MTTNTRPRRNRYELHYHRLEQMLDQPLRDFRPGLPIRLRAPGFMDLVVEVLPPCPETGGMVLSLAHYFEQNGDLCQDPEMTVRLFHPGSTVFLGMTPSTAPDHGRAEALSFQQALPPIYQQVYVEPGIYRPRLRQELNTFLGQWLRNLRDQGHQRIEVKGDLSA